MERCRSSCLKSEIAPGYWAEDWGTVLRLADSATPGDHLQALTDARIRLEVGLLNLGYENSDLRGNLPAVVKTHALRHGLSSDLAYRVSRGLKLRNEVIHKGITPAPQFIRNDIRAIKEYCDAIGNSVSSPPLISESSTTRSTSQVLNASIQGGKFEVEVKPEVAVKPEAEAIVQDLAGVAAKIAVGVAGIALAGKVVSVGVQAVDGILDGIFHFFRNALIFISIAAIVLIIVAALSKGKGELKNDEQAARRADAGVADSTSKIESIPIIDPCAKCAIDTICVNGTCITAFGREYRIAVISATISLRKSNGTNWDKHDAPDAYAQVKFNNRLLGSTKVIKNSYEPIWNAATPAQRISPDDKLVIDIYDYDGGPSLGDDIMSCDIRLTTLALRQSRVSCTGPHGALSVSIEPL
jgi:hypothetical protein